MRRPPAVAALAGVLLPGLAGLQRAGTEAPGRPPDRGSSDAVGRRPVLVEPLRPTGPRPPRDVRPAGPAQPDVETALAAVRHLAGRDRAAAGDRAGVPRGGRLGRRPAARLGLPGASVSGCRCRRGVLGRRRCRPGRSASVVAMPPRHRPDPTPPGGRGAPRHGPAGAGRARTTPRASGCCSPSPSRWRGGVPGCRWCSWPSPPRSRAVRPTTTTTSARGTTSRRCGRPSGGPCGAWCRSTASASGRCVPVCSATGLPDPHRAGRRPGGRAGRCAGRRVRQPLQRPLVVRARRAARGPHRRHVVRRLPQRRRHRGRRAPRAAGAHGPAGRGVGGAARLGRGTARCCGARRRRGRARRARHGPAAAGTASSRT